MASREWGFQLATPTATRYFPLAESLYNLYSSFFTSR